MMVRPKMPTPYRLIFLDLDGTLVDKDDVVSPRTLAALDGAQQRGSILVICTGRNRFMVEHIAAQWSGHGYGVFSNGAVIAEWETGRVLQKIALAASIVRGAASLAHAFGMAPLCFGVHVGEDGGQSVYTDRVHPVVPAYACRNAQRLVFQDDLTAGVETEESEIGPVGMAVYGGEQETKALAVAWRNTFGSDVWVYHSRDGKYGCWCAFMNARAANKAHAARTVADILGVPQEQTLAIGDELNDLEMLQWAGLGVCMGDGHAEVRARADHVTGTLHEDGAAQAIERFALGTMTSGL